MAEADFPGFVHVTFIPEPSHLAQQFDEVAAALANMTGPLEASAQIIGRGMQETIDAEGPGWDEHALSTIKRWGPHPLLVGETEDLYESLTNENNYNVQTYADGGELVWTGEAAPGYAGFHITGTSRMPQRDFTQWTRMGDAEAELEAMWQAWVDENLAPIGLGGGIYEPPEFRPVIAGKYGTRYFGVHPVTGNIGFIPNPYA